MWFNHPRSARRRMSQLFRSVSTWTQYSKDIFSENTCSTNTCNPSKPTCEFIYTHIDMRFLGNPYTFTKPPHVQKAHPRQSQQATCLGWLPWLWLPSGDCTSKLIMHVSPPKVPPWVSVSVSLVFFGCHVFVFIVYLHRFMCNETSIIRLFQLMAYVPITIG